MINIITLILSFTDAITLLTMDSTKENEAKSSYAGEKLTRLGDLPFDCLVKIFDNINVKELINVVDYDIRVRAAARFIFKKNFSDEKYTVLNVFDPRREETQSLLKLIKFFGTEITKLRIKYIEEYRSVDYILDNTIVAECHKSLIEIEFINANAFNMHNIDKSFEKVRKVMFAMSRCCHLIWNFNKWFPNAHTLCLVSQKSIMFEDRQMLKQCFPALKHFRIGNMPNEEKPPEIWNYKNLNNYSVMMFIHLNPQLKSFLIAFNKFASPQFVDLKWNYEILEAIHSSLTDLESLYIEIGPGDHKFDVSEFDFSQLNFFEIKEYRS